MKRLLLLSGLSLLSLQGFSQAMYLDSTFSNDGLVYDLFNQHSWGTDVAVQADGKILGTIQRDDMFRIYRLNVDGSWDTGFDTDGMVEVDVAMFGAEECNGLVIQPDGKILVVGTASFTGNGMDAVLIRLETDGTLDANFGTGGIVSTNAGGSLNDYGRRVLLRPNGKILVAGIGGAGQSSDKQLLIQYNADGTLDNNFGTNGVVLSSYQSNMTDLFDFALQADGKIVVSGNTFLNGNNAEVVVARYDSLGALDMGFGTNGWIVYGFNNGTFEVGKRILVQSTGKIVVCSRSYDKMYRMYFNRFNADGTVDNSFGTSGATYFDFSTNTWQTHELTEAILMPNDDILVSGAITETVGEFNYGMVRLNAGDGSVQTGWADNGTIRTDFLGFYDFIYGMDIAPDGKLVAAGSSRIDAVTTYSYPSVARYKMIATSVGEVQRDLSVQVYPNPSNGSFVIEGNEAATIHIMNAVGQIIGTVELSAKNNYTQKVLNLPQGIFFLQSANGVMNHKIVSY